MHENLSDYELQELWHQGNEWAFEVIYKRYAVRLVSIALQKTGNRQVAEEIVQDTFLIMFNRQKDPPYDSMFAYLYVIMKNKLLDIFKHEQVRKKYEQLRAHSYTESDESLASTIETRDLERIIDAEIEKLPPQCKTVFTLSRKQLLSNREIGLALSISENTVEQHIRKAIRTIRQSLLNDLKMMVLLI